MIFLLFNWLSDNNLLFCVILLLDVVCGLLDMLGYGTLSRRLKTIRKDIRRHVVLDFCRFLNVILLNINTYT